MSDVRSDGKLLDSIHSSFYHYIAVAMKNLFLLASFAVAGLCSSAPANVTFNNVRRLLFDTDGNQIDA